MANNDTLSAGADPVAHVPPLPARLIAGASFEAQVEVHRQDDLAREGRFDGTHVMPGGSDLQRLAVLAEEFGEVSIEVCKGILPDEQVRRVGLREELIQVAAVAIAWVAAIDDERATELDE